MTVSPYLLVWCYLLKYWGVTQLAACKANFDKRSPTCNICNGRCYNTYRAGRTAGRPPLSHAYFSLNLLTLLSLPVPLNVETKTWSSSSDADDSQKIHFKDAFIASSIFFWYMLRSADSPPNYWVSFGIFFLMQAG
jgi:hypothetical protein